MKSSLKLSVIEAPGVQRQLWKSTLKPYFQVLSTIGKISKMNRNFKRMFFNEAKSQRFDCGSGCQ
jgi:hypothetical protein